VAAKRPSQAGFADLAMNNAKSAKADFVEVKLFGIML
jgi:hypothetical protein